MSRKRTKKNPKDELNAMRKILCDEASNQMKVRNFAKALIGFNQVNEATLRFNRAHAIFERNDKALLDVVMEPPIGLFIRKLKLLIILASDIFAKKQRHENGFRAFAKLCPLRSNA